MQVRLTGSTVCVTFLILISSATNLRCQSPDFVLPKADRDSIDRLASDTANLIQQESPSEKSKALVFDFARGPEGTSSQLGTVLADRFSESLSALSNSVKVMNRKILTNYLDKNWISQDDLANQYVCLWIARGLGATGVITGSLLEENGQITVQVRLTGFGSLYNKVDQFAQHDEIARLTLTGEAKALLAQRGPGYAHIPEDISDEPFILKTGLPGITQPRCVKCPGVQVSEYTRLTKFQGAVRLSVIVNSEGKITSIYVLKGVPYLDAEAIKTIQAWQLRPAEQDGRPVSVRTEFEIKFNVY